MSLNTQGLFPLVLTNSSGSEILGDIQGIMGTGQEDTFIYRLSQPPLASPASPSHPTMGFTSAPGCETLQVGARMKRSAEM